MFRRAIQFLTSGVPVSLRRGVPSVVVLAAARSDYYGPLFTRKTLTRFGSVISVADRSIGTRSPGPGSRRCIAIGMIKTLGLVAIGVACLSIAAAPASAGIKMGFGPIQACGFSKCLTSPKARARKAIAEFEKNAETPVTIHDCRHDRRLVVCFLSRPIPPDPESALIGVEWWDCAGPRGKVTSSFTSERCQWAAYRAFPELGD